MRNKEQKFKETKDLFKPELSEQIDLSHKLCLLADFIDWEKLDDYLSNCFSEDSGRQSKPSRLIAALFYLKSLYKRSDEELVETWLENPYWQYFCGERYFQHRFPIDPSSLSKWRKRLGSQGMEKLFEMILVCAQAHKLLPQSELKTVIADTTVQEKAISYPLDSKLYYNMRERLVKAAASYGIELRQSYVRVAKKSLLMCSRYAHAKQYKRMRRELKRLKGYLARVYRDMDRKTKKLSKVPLEVTELLHLSNRLLNQKVKDKKKLYAIHAPEVECIAKGKAHKKYEFGVKASIVATVKSGWILCSHSLHGNPYDGHTLKSSLSKAKELSGADIKEIVVTRGMVLLMSRFTAQGKSEE